MRVDFEQLKFPDHVTPMILLSLNTGLRRGELFSLQWSDVDLSRAILRLKETLLKAEKPGIYR